MMTLFEEIKAYLVSDKIGIVNIKRQKDLFDSYAIIKEIIETQNSDAFITIEHGALQDGSVAIRVVTNDITVYDMDKFAMAIRNADNFQIYPTIDDRVKFDIMFHNVIKYTLQKSG